MPLMSNLFIFLEPQKKSTMTIRSVHEHGTQHQCLYLHFNCTAKPTSPIDWSTLPLPAGINLNVNLCHYVHDPQCGRLCAGDCVVSASHGAQTAMRVISSGQKRSVLKRHAHSVGAG
ncbi:unnamed protein product [Ostreobium quekettii]|uniref:Uncharacterized protein n=1 Tax=Ostreobium quekettii TaxID=121088 RepID=A0A8S1IXV4_9CHLO|nr:unnamed protein product [Ostreobium quekettii]